MLDLLETGAGALVVSNRLVVAADTNNQLMANLVERCGICF